MGARWCWRNFDESERGSRHLADRLHEGWPNISSLVRYKAWRCKRSLGISFGGSSQVPFDICWQMPLLIEMIQDGNQIRGILIVYPLPYFCDARGWWAAMPLKHWQISGQVVAKSGSATSVVISLIASRVRDGRTHIGIRNVF